MKAAVRQTPFRFTTEADPRFCAKAFCRAGRNRKKPTHVVTLVGGQSFRVCTSCARPYESVRGARVEKIVEVTGV